MTTRGPVLTLEYPEFYLVSCYTPTARTASSGWITGCSGKTISGPTCWGWTQKKPVILCGDLNVAHTEIDIKNAKTNRMSAGFTDQERAKMTELLAAGLRTVSVPSTRTR